MADAYCKACHAWVTHDTSPSGRHEHPADLVTPSLGTSPKPGTDSAKVLQAMMDGPVIDTHAQGSAAWWSTWDLVPYTNSVHVRDFIRDLKHMGWTFDERWTTAQGKRYKEWRLVLPKHGSQEGLF